jgi:hypothetical protein
LLGIPQIRAFSTYEVLSQLLFVTHSFITIVPALISTYLVFFGGLSKWFHMGNFLFFRFGYDIGIGLLLRAQSKTNWMIRTYERLSRDKTANSIMNYFIRSGLRPAHRTLDLDKLPSAFKAWVVFKYVVTCCLCNDGCAYILLGILLLHFYLSHSLNLNSLSQ